MKLRKPYDFLIAVTNYQIGGETIASTVSLLLPWFEVVTGACLLVGILLSGAFGMVALFGIVFTGIQLLALARGLEIGCGCFGSLEQEDKIGAMSIARALVLLVLGFAGLIALHRVRSMPPSILFRKAKPTLSPVTI